MEEILTSAIQHYGVWAIVAAFGIGLLTALAPCSIVTLPLLIGSAVALSGDMDGREKRQFIYRYALLFVLGLVISFSLLMLAVAKIGMMLAVAPFWAYALASVATWVVIAYAMGWIGSVDKGRVTERFLRYKLLGAVIIGLIFGFVSTPCATAPLVAIITVAEQAGWLYAYLLVLAFALGHASLLLLAGVSVGTAQKIASHSILNRLSSAVNAVAIIGLVIIACYFAYKSYQVW